MEDPSAKLLGQPWYQPHGKGQQDLNEGLHVGHDAFLCRYCLFMGMSRKIREKNLLASGQLRRTRATRLTRELTCIDLREKLPQSAYVVNHIQGPILQGLFGHLLASGQRSEQ